jgi:hypothetical protein
MERSRPPAGSTPSIDLVRALDLLAGAVAGAGAEFVHPMIQGGRCRCPYARGGGLQCLVGRALSLAQVGDAELEALGDRGVRELHRQGRLPVRLTLGALIVFDAAQRCQDRGWTWADALDHATSAAERYLDLLPGSAFGGIGRSHPCRPRHARAAGRLRDAATPAPVRIGFAGRRGLPGPA